MEKMLSPKRLIKIARKWPMNDGIGRTISSSKEGGGSKSCDTAAAKDTFVIYTIDKTHFVLPLPYLGSYVFQELLKMSGEEFGVSSKEPIVLPCDSLRMNYIVSLFCLGMSSDLEKAIVDSIIMNCCSFSELGQEQLRQHVLLCAY